MKYILCLVVSVMFAPFAYAQINSNDGDLVFTTNNNEVARITTSNVFEVSGSLKINNTSATCNGSTAGFLRYNSNNLELCNGINWAGLVSSTIVTIPTPSTSGHFFVLSSFTTNGNMGGRSGADALCLTDMQNNDFWAKSTAGSIAASRVKAFLTGDELEINTEYFFAKAGDTSVGGSSFTTDGSGLGPDNSDAWDGSTYFGGNETYWTSVAEGTSTKWAVGSTLGCSGYTSTSTDSDVGIARFSNSTRWKGPFQTGCSGSNNLICIVNVDPSL